MSAGSLILLRLHISTCIGVLSSGNNKTLSWTKQTSGKELSASINREGIVQLKEEVTLNQRSSLKLLVPNCHEVLQSLSF